ncbi:MAG TPA: hypothetical protein VME24_04625 [Alphaproteobacteria bacterium]|nr:hypothetical protein [Alphaproteobacteria bacterium]
MQRFRFLSVVFATSLVSGAFVAHADPDTPAQAAARAALQQQMNQMGTEEPPGSTNTTPPPAIAEPTPQFSTNVPDEMESDMAGMQTNQSATAQMKSQTNMAAITAPPPSALNTNETEQYPVNPAMAPLPPPPLETTSTPPPGGPAHPPTAALSNAAQPPGASSGPGPSLQTEPKGTNSAPNFETITAPPLPISPEKQSELQNLYSQYMANQITPAQYQEQRAKILAEP